MDEQLDKFHYHEALDRSYMVQCHLDNALENHPILQIKEVKEQYEKASNELVELYLILGRLTFKETK